MKDIDEDLIYEQFEGYSYDVMNKTFSKLLKMKRKEDKKINKDREEKFNKAVKELLEICPQVNMIPIGEHYLYHKDCYDTNDFDDIYDVTHSNMEDYAVPKQYDDMTIGTYRKMMDLWEIACKNSPIVYEEFDGDYCEYPHIFVYYYDRESGEIMTTKEF